MLVFSAIVNPNIVNMSNKVFIREQEKLDLNLKFINNNEVVQNEQKRFVIQNLYVNKNIIATRSLFVELLQNQINKGTEALEELND